MFLNRNFVCSNTTRNDVSALLDTLVTEILFLQYLSKFLLKHSKLELDFLASTFSNVQIHKALSWGALADEVTVLKE